MRSMLSSNSFTSNQTLFSCTGKSSRRQPACLDSCYLRGGLWVPGSGFGLTRLWWIWSGLGVNPAVGGSHSFSLNNSALQIKKLILKCKTKRPLLGHVHYILASLSLSFRFALDPSFLLKLCALGGHRRWLSYLASGGGPRWSSCVLTVSLPLSLFVSFLLSSPWPLHFKHKNRNWISSGATTICPVFWTKVHWHVANQ